MRERLDDFLWENTLWIEKTPDPFPVKPWTRIGDRRHLFEAHFPVSDAAEKAYPPGSKKPVHFVFGMVYDLGIEDFAVRMKYWEKAVAEGLSDGVWLQRKETK